jgi:hypothetical protein
MRGREREALPRPPSPGPQPHEHPDDDEREQYVGPVLVDLHEPAAEEPLQAERMLLHPIPTA